MAAAATGRASRRLFVVSVAVVGRREEDRPAGSGLAVPGLFRECHLCVGSMYFMLA